jgi:hypothetical protein
LIKKILGSIVTLSWDTPKAPIFWKPELIKEFKFKYFEERDTKYAFKEYREKPLAENYATMKNFLSQLFAAE